MWQILDISGSSCPNCYATLVSLLFSDVTGAELLLYLLHGGTRRIVRYEQIKFTCYILLFPPIRRKREFSLTHDHNNPHVTDLFLLLHLQTRVVLNLNCIFTIIELCEPQYSITEVILMSCYHSSN